MGKKPMLANYTTTVPVEETIAEIQTLLIRAGARSIQLHFEDGRITAIDFVITLDRHPLQFRLPQNAAAAHKVLQRTAARAQWKKPAHAERVSWRILRDWVRAQLAMVELSQAELAQVFLPYAMVNGGAVWAQFRESRQKQLSSGGESH